jgi:hypothetical protein
MEPDEDGTTLWYSTLAEAGWQPPRPVVTGKNMFVNWADMPSVSALTSEHWVAHWLEMAGPLTYSYHVVMAQSFDGGESWSEPVKPHTDGTPTEHGFVSVYPYDGKVAAIWLDGRKTGGEHGSDPQASGMTLRGAVIDADNALQREQEIARSGTSTSPARLTGDGSRACRLASITGGSLVARSTDPLSRQWNPT